MPHWTITRMGPVEDKTAVVTGANSGLGLPDLPRARRATAPEWSWPAAMPNAGKKALERLRADVPDADVELARSTWPTCRR